MMNKKDFLKKILMSFFIIVTFVNVAMFILGMLYDDRNRFGYEAFLFPIVYGILGILPMAVLYSKKELTVKQMLFRKVIQLILLEALLIFCVFSNGGLGVRPLIPFVVIVLLIALAVQGILWILDSRRAQELSVELEKYQRKQHNL